MHMARFEGIGLCCGNYGSKDVGEKIFGGENTIRSQMKVEAALAKAEAEAGIIPEEAAREIAEKCRTELISEEEYFRQLAITGHPLMGLVRCYAAVCSNGFGQYVHYGTTTQDILDTAVMLQLRQAYEVIEDKVHLLRNILISLAEKYKSTVVIGRTNDQQAMPITLGFRFASWLDELNRSAERLKEDKKRIFAGQFGGAVGTLASLGPAGLEVRRIFLEELGLDVPVIAWYAARDRLAELCSDLCILMGALGRIGNEVYNAQKTEVNELAEGFVMGKVGSSTMPHKRNPFVSGRVVTYARLSRSVMMDALTAMEGTNERDVRSLLMENDFLTRIFLLADGALDECMNLLSHMEIHENGIRRNLGLQNGLVYAEALMMHLAGKYGRLEAHEIIYEAAQQAISEDVSFRELIKKNPKVKQVLTDQEIDSIMVPEAYTGLAEYFTDAVCGEKPAGPVSAESQESAEPRKNQE